MRLVFVYIALSLVMSGCLFQPDKVETFGLDRNAAKGGSVAKATVSAVSIVNDQLVINGSALDGVNTVRITGPSGFDETFAIESKTASNLIANGLKNISFAVGAVFSLIISDAYGAATFQVTFTLQDGAVTASKLASMGAGIGQVLKYDGTTWVPSDLGGLTYAGNWNATTNSPDLSGGGNLGEYYIVNNSGTYDLLGGAGTNSWAVGDWVVWNNVLAQWEKIDNATNLQSFNGRSGAVTPQSGDYTWAQIDKTTSSINDIADVDTTGIASGKILKWNGSAWVISDDLNGGGAGSVTTTEIADGTIADADISGSAAIAQSKIANLSTDLSSKLPLAGGTMTGNIAMGANNITFSTGLVDGVDVSALSSQVSTNTTNISGKEPTLTKGNLTEATSSVLTITSGTNAIIGTGTTIEVKQANTTTSGYLTNTDWNTFNNKLGTSNVDNSTIEVSGGNLQVKDSGISTAKVADGAITGIKILNTLEAKAADYTVTTADNNKVFLVSGASTLTLPAAATAGSGFAITVKNTDASNTVTIDGNSTETIDGNEVSELKSQYATAQLISNGSAWFITYSTGTLGTGPLSCPTGFVAVTGNATFGTSDFCVMAYEAKSDGGGNAVSQVSGNPWVSINATTAQSTCEAMTEGGFSGTFTLISNPEWMTIARDLEGVATNWSSGTVGTGDLARGWSAATADDGFQNSAVAPSTGASCLYNTAANTCGSSGTHKLRRTHQLSNGSEIWDFAGNVWEWVDWSTTGSFTSGPTDGTNSWQELTSLSGSVTANDLQTSGGYTSTQQAGRWFGGSGGAALRGGDWSVGSFAGAFTLYLNIGPLFADATFGFRCVYRP